MKIEFNEQKHEYKVNEQKAISVTTLLRAVGLGKDYGEFDKKTQEIVKKAAERGNYYDKLAEDAFNNPFELNEWQTRFLKTLKENNIEINQAQTRVGTTKPFPIAGTPDFTGTKAVVDLKATYQIYINDVTWQTNMYAWLMDKENHEIFKKYVIHYNEKDDRFTVIKLKDIPTKNITRALECYMLDEKYSEDDNALTNVINLPAFSIAFDKLQNFKQEIKKAEEEVDAYYQKIIEHMENESIKTIELENFKITYTPPTTRKSLDYKRYLSKKNITLTPQEEEEFTKTSEVKSRLTVTRK